eukprot:NODE_666_length_4904_cov_0.563580.p2 type:complete len:570 gc:universal NODE_666_length_4904_cov_0.563580:581-2290(+)
MSIPRMLLTLLAVFANGDLDLKWGYSESDRVYKPSSYAIEASADFQSRDGFRFYEVSSYYNDDDGNPFFYNVRDHSTNGKLSEPLIIANELRMAVVSNGLQNFYPGPVALDQLAHKISKDVDFKEIAKLVGKGTPLKEAYKLARLALYDIHMVADDSGSIFDSRFPERVRELKEYSTMLINIVSLFDSNGLDFYFLNNFCDAQNGKYKFRNSDEFIRVFNGINRGGCTPTGSTLSDRVIKPLFRNMNQFNKPVLVYLLTDGVPNHNIIYNRNERNEATRNQQYYDDVKAGKLLVENAFLDAYVLKEQFEMQQNAIEFVIGQIGDDAQKWLDMFDDYPIIAPQVDVTDDFGSEKKQVFKRNGHRLKKWEWVMKYVLGAIDDKRDGLDSYRTKLPAAVEYGTLNPDTYNPGANLDKYNEKIQRFINSDGSVEITPGCCGFGYSSKEIIELEKEMKQRIREYKILKVYSDHYLERRATSLNWETNYSLDRVLFIALAAEFGSRESQYLNENTFDVELYHPFTQYDMHIANPCVHNYLPKTEETNQQFGSETDPSAPLASENMGHRPPAFAKW